MTTGRERMHPRAGRNGTHRERKSERGRGWRRLEAAAEAREIDHQDVEHREAKHHESTAMPRLNHGDALMLPNVPAVEDDDEADQAVDSAIGRAVGPATGSAAREPAWAPAPMMAT